MPRLTSGGPPPSRRRINRAPSPVLAHTLPWLTILLGSMIPGWLLIASAPVMPPLGFLLFIAWRQLRPGLLPIWSALPLGLFDDLFAKGCDLYRGLGALEQGNLQLLFQLLHRHREGRLGDETALGGAAKVALLSQGYDIAEFC